MLLNTNIYCTFANSSEFCNSEKLLIIFCDVYKVSSLIMQFVILTNISHHNENIMEVWAKKYEILHIISFNQNIEYCVC